MEIKNNNEAYEMASILLAYLQDRMTPEKQAKLDSWLSASEEHRSLFAQLTDEESRIQEIKKLQSYEKGKVWQVIRNNVRKRRMRRLQRVVSVAAMLILIIGSVLFFNIQQRGVQEPSADRPVSAIVPGHSVARLTVADGNSYLLDSMAISSLPHATVLNGNEIVFKEKDSSGIMPESRYSKLEIPLGGEYKITLSDGTRIYLNSATELKFPEDFTGYEERTVYLAGEAYFEVAKDGGKPFVVKCGSYDVKVLGTSFNISNYADNAYSHTTLKEGKVEILREGRQVALQPGQQAKLENGNLEVVEVDVENYTTWMNENFRFESENIEEILKRIARWYVVDIFYANTAVRDYHFTGYLPRYAEIGDVLELLSLTTNIHFEIKGKTIVVR